MNTRPVQLLRIVIVTALVTLAFVAGVMFDKGQAALLVILGIAAVLLIGLDALALGRTLRDRATLDKLLRTARDRMTAISSMANTLGGTLDYNKVLNAAMDIGVMGLRESSPDARLMSMVLLFDGGVLKVVSQRHMPYWDEAVTVPGRRGVLAAALERAEPLFVDSVAQDPELSYFAALSAAKSVLLLPLRARYDNFGVLVFGSNKPDAFSEDHLELLTSLSAQATVAIQNAQLIDNLRRERERLIEVDEEARKKLARDLHDGPTQSVSAIAMRVNYIKVMVERNMPNAIQELQKVEDLAQQTVKEIRSMLFTLRPLVLESQGLAAALEQLKQKMHDTYDLPVTLELQPNVQELLSANAQSALFYIIEEAVNNARKHARATNITVRLFRRGQNAYVEIQDNGVGFDVEEVQGGYDQRGSLGMVNMRERAETAGGALSLESARGRGTKISVIMPLSPSSTSGSGGQNDPAIHPELSNSSAGPNGRPGSRRPPSKPSNQTTRTEPDRNRFSPRA